MSKVQSDVLDSAEKFVPHKKFIQGGLIQVSPTRAGGSEFVLTAAAESTGNCFRGGVHAQKDA